MRNTTMLAALLASLLLATPLLLGEELFHDDFEDGELAAPGGPRGLSWQTLGGAASVKRGQDGNRRLLLKGEGLVVSEQEITAREYTVRLDAGVAWSSPCRLVFLYRDPDNYYSFGIGARSRGFFRKRGGQEETLYGDPTSKLVLPHQRDAGAAYKIYVKNDGAALTIQLDRHGDGVDYDVEFTETDPGLVAESRAGRIGMMCQGGETPGRFDGIVVSNTKVSDDRQGVTYYVDAVSGDDSRSSAEARRLGTPWKTIGRAAETARAGDTVRVLPGVYREAVVPARRGGRGASITFAAHDPENRPVLDGSKFVKQDAWESVEITDFRGRKQRVNKAPLDWAPAMVYQGERRMFPAQEPNQRNADDPYELSLFREVPAAHNDGKSSSVIVDPAFFVQKAPDYWQGALLLLYDSFPNVIAESEITGGDPDRGLVTVRPFKGAAIGATGRAPPDRYAIRRHPGVLDQPGEYYIDTSVVPHEMYVWPYEGVAANMVSAGFHENGFKFAKGREHIVVDGFVVRSYNADGIALGPHVNHISVRNCVLRHNMRSGVAGSLVSDIAIENCLLRDNHANGASFGYCADITVAGCEITANGDNGLWFGSGGGGVFNGERIRVRGCRIHHQGARRRHPDNFQMHQCRDVVLEDNVFVQDGHQNMWCQYSDNFVLRNNLFLGGALGINSAMRNHLFHNLFYRSSLRYDRHLDNHPERGDWYKPQEVVIRNNVLIESAIAWPDPGILDRFRVFTVDHNYYNIEKQHGLSAWDWGGRRLALLPNGALVVSDAELVAAGGRFSLTAAVVWSHPGRIVFLYRDPNNYYWLGLGAQKGIHRRLKGEETCLHEDRENRLRLPHKRCATGKFDVAVAADDAGITITVSRDGDGGARVEVTDRAPGVVRAFASGRIGALCPGRKGAHAKLFLDDVTVEAGGGPRRDDFERSDLRRQPGAGELGWQVVAGEARIAPARGRGIGFGAGSVVHRDLAELGDVIRRPPREASAKYDFRPTAGSPLIDAGLDVDVKRDLDGRARPVGESCDIGPYEHSQ